VVDYLKTVIRLSGDQLQAPSAEGTVVGATSTAAAAAGEEDDDDVAAEWSLTVRAVTESAVRGGAVAERVATEGVMLQYAVDTKLDVLLSESYARLTAPPLLPNPYPRLLHAIRAQSARMELWRDDDEDAAAALLNDLTMLPPPSFLYRATPPALAGGRRRGRRPAAAAAEAEGGEELAVYGCYAAVAMADCGCVRACAPRGEGGGDAPPPPPPLPAGQATSRALWR